MRCVHSANLYLAGGILLIVYTGAHFDWTGQTGKTEQFCQTREVANGRYQSRRLGKITCGTADVADVDDVAGTAVPQVGAQSACAACEKHQLVADFARNSVSKSEKRAIRKLHFDLINAVCCLLSMTSIIITTAIRQFSIPDVEDGEPTP